MNRRRLFGLLAAMSLPLPTGALADMSASDRDLFERMRNQVLKIVTEYSISDGWPGNNQVVDGALQAIDDYLGYLERNLGSFDTQTALTALDDLVYLEKILDQIDPPGSAKEAGAAQLRARDLRRRMRVLREMLIRQAS